MQNFFVYSPAVARRVADLDVPHEGGGEGFRQQRIEVSSLKYLPTFLKAKGSRKKGPFFKWPGD